MSAERNTTAQEHAFEEMSGSGESTGQHLTLDSLGRVHLKITAELGSAIMTVREVLELHQGSVVALSKLAGEMADLRLNGDLLAKGEIVVVGDALHVRIAEIVGTQDVGNGAG